MQRILVIEDEHSILENVVETLEMENFEVRGAPNGRLGVEIAKAYLPDLILCDIMMPKLNGYGVLLELRQDPNTANIPFVFLTAKAERADMRKGMELGADDYLVKPFTTSELLAAVGARLDRRGLITREYEQKLDNLRENIIRALPHELRTPLTGIIGYSEMLLMDFDMIERDQAHMMIDAIYKSGARLHRLIENYLIYAQVELMMTDLNRLNAVRSARPLPSQPIIARIAAKKAEEYCRENDVQLRLCDGAARIYQDSLEKIAAELIDNALKFSANSTAVEVDTYVNDSGLVFSVQDYGRGLTPQQINDIGAYMQFERALYEQQGLGLGLIIAKRLVELHGGQWTIDSKLGQGTRVSVLLPM